ncbi:hypothetical protein BCO37747_07932 [Burkholderia contaminans]|nr:hypothetical protein BCO23253_06865 [Burkholderia contaminans]VWD65098.1 hypothetical protein BCO37747_07932 [Burkholderia contaminans]
MRACDSAAWVARSLTEFASRLSAARIAPATTCRRFASSSVGPAGAACVAGDCGSTNGDESVSDGGSPPFAVDSDGAGNGDDVGSVGVPVGAALAAVDSDDAGREDRPLAVDSDGASSGGWVVGFVKIERALTCAWICDAWSSYCCASVAP